MYKQLTREQRYAIYLGVQEKKTQAAIARQIGVNKSTVSRELKRNSNRHHSYWWSIAHERATDRRGRTVRNRETSPSVLREARRLLLTEEWSPRQISGWLKKKGVSISHERIYEMIREDESGELRLHCRHRKIAEALKTTVYFADSYSSWQKGAIENANKLIRQYIPKGTDFRELTDEYIRSVHLKLNRRPREKLNFSTPKDEFFKLLLCKVSIDTLQFFFS